MAEYMVQNIAAQSEIESRKLLKFISAIYRVDNVDNPEQFGTGVLLVIHDHYFLVTAAHVLDDNTGSTLYIPGNQSGKLEMLTGGSFRSVADGGNRDNDRTDVGVVALKSDLVDKIGCDSFLPVSMTDVDDIGKAGEIYIAMGYPATKNTKVNLVEKTFKRHVISCTANILPGKDLEKIGVSSASHLLLGFDKKHVKNTQGKDMTAPDPYGISGGPLWRFDIYTKQNPASRLVGILIEWRKEVKGMLAVRIPVLIAGMAVRYPQLKSFLPQTTTVNVQVEVI